MDLTHFVCEDTQKHEGIVFMRNRNTSYPVVIKHADMEEGINEIHAYQCMEASPLIDFAIHSEGVKLMLHRYDGTSLEDAMEDGERRHRLIEHIDRVFSSAVRSLRKIHSLGICHGNIKPSKVMVDEDFSVNFIGYGSSCKLDESGSPFLHSVYTAPEIVLGGEVDRRLADYYSLGRSLYALVREGECRDYETLDKICALTSVIPKHRERI